MQGQRNNYDEGDRGYAQGTAAQPSNQPSTSSNMNIVQGTASNIQLFQNKSLQPTQSKNMKRKLRRFKLLQRYLELEKIRTPVKNIDNVPKVEETLKVPKVNKKLKVNPNLIVLKLNQKVKVPKVNEDLKVNQNLKVPDENQNLKVPEGYQNPEVPEVYHNLKVPKVNKKLKVNPNLIVLKLNQKVKVPKVNEDLKVNQKLKVPIVNENPKVPEVNENLKVPKVSKKLKVNPNLIVLKLNQKVKVPKVNESPKVPKAPEVNQNLKVPKVKENLKVPKVNQNLKVPKVKENLKVPIVNENLKVPKVKENLKVPIVNENLKVPEVNQYLKVPKVKENLKVPIVNENLKVPEVNQYLKVPKVKENLKVPIVNENLKVPEVNQNLEVPKVNQNLKVPEVNQNLKVPKINQNLKVPKAKVARNYGPFYDGSYPKGIPRSFLTAQHIQNITANQTGTLDIFAPTEETFQQSKITPQTMNYQNQTKHFQPISQLIPTQIDTNKFKPLKSPDQKFKNLTPPEHMMTEPKEPMSVQNDQNKPIERQVYSPSDVYNDGIENDSGDDENMDGETMDVEPGSKRLSAFKRLGPVTQPKKPKMTINWICNKDVREVVETVEDDDVPTQLKEYITSSTDEIVMRYLSKWPWLNPPNVRRVVSARQSKSVLLFELEQMDELYKKDSTFFQISVTGYPENWKKEDVLDTLMETVKGNSFIPCFVDFTKTECKFLVIRCRSALLTFHKNGFLIKKQDNIELNITISVINLSLNHIDYVPRLILRKRLQNRLKDDVELDLKEFTLKKDISHFIYFPLNRHTNQLELLNLQSTVAWDKLTKLDLSNNRLKNIHGFFLRTSTPKLRHLNLSNNLLDKMSCLFECRNLPLNTICLEGNPLCSDYIDKDHYVKVLKLLFPALVEIDGVKLSYPNGIPPTKQNYCSEEAKHVVEKVLEVFFPLLEAENAERLMIQDMYDSEAVMTITHSPKLRYAPIYLDFRSIFKYARILEEGETLSIEGASSIAKVICKWPLIEHDPHTFTVDVLYHTDTTTIVRIGGMLKLTSESLAEEEHLMYFTRTLVLKTKDCVEYRIHNEMVYWELPTRECSGNAFKSTSILKLQPSLKLESPPDDELKENLLQIFMNLTQMEKKPSEKCLETKNWHLRNALDYFISLLKLDNLDPLIK